MPLPRYSLDDGGDAIDETLQESYSSVASASHTVPTWSAPPDAADAGADAGAPMSFEETPSFRLDRSVSPSVAAYDAPSSLDIDALLESTGPHHTKDNRSSWLASASEAVGWPYSRNSPIARLTPFEQLTLYMSTQKAAPELLPFPTHAFDSLIGQMEQQQSILDSLLHLPPSNAQDEEQDAPESGVDEDEFLRLNLVQVDLERCKWLLKHILRTRMDLLQKFGAFIVARQNERRKLNDAEDRFVGEFWQLKKDHFHSAVLGYLPEQLHDLTTGQPADTDDLSQQDTQQPNNSSNMVPGPDLDAPVFLRCLQDCGEITLPDNEKATLSNESMHLLRYRSIRHLVYQGVAVLL